VKHVTEHRTSLEKVPRRTWIQKGRKTACGILLIPCVVYMKRHGWFPDWFHMALIGFAGYCIAGDYVRAFTGFVKASAKDVAEAIREIRSALKGNGK
jgi:hypothetical protein